MAELQLNGHTIISGSVGNHTIASGVNIPASIGGSLVLVSTTSGTGVSELKFENTFNDTSIYKYIIEADLLPTTDDRHIVAQFGYGGASTTWITSNYRTILIETNSKHDYAMQQYSLKW